MRNYSKTVGALVAASALVAGYASAAAPDLEGEVYAGYTSAYLFRGLNLGQDLAEAGVQVTTKVPGDISLTAGAWYGSFKAPTYLFDGTHNEDELDLYAEVSKDFGFVTGAVGYIYYYYPQGDANSLFNHYSDTAEAYFKLSHDFGFVDASLTYYWDTKGDNDGYTEAALSKGFKFNECLTLNVGGALGYLAEQGQLAHFTAKVSLDYNFTGTATVSPFVANSWSLSDDNDTAYYGAKNQLVGGVKVSVGF